MGLLDKFTLTEFLLLGIFIMLIVVAFYTYYNAYYTALLTEAYFRSNGFFDYLSK